MFEVKVKQAEILVDGSEFEYREQKVTSPEDGATRAVISAEVYGNTEQQHKMLEKAFADGDATVEIYKKQNGHLAFDLIVEAYPASEPEETQAEVIQIPVPEAGESGELKAGLDGLVHNDDPQPEQSEEAA